MLDNFYYCNCTQYIKSKLLLCIITYHISPKLAPPVANAGLPKKPAKNRNGHSTILLLDSAY